MLNDAELYERARNIRNKGTNRDQFFEGKVDKYTWVELGSSYLSPEILSAFPPCQLEARDHIQQRRQSIWHRYQLDAPLKDHGVQAVFHFIPLHLSPMGQKFGAKEGDCPVAEGVSARLVRLPFFTGVSEDEQALILKNIQQFGCDCRLGCPRRTAAPSLRRTVAAQGRFTSLPVRRRRLPATIRRWRCGGSRSRLSSVP